MIIKILVFTFILFLNMTFGQSKSSEKFASGLTTEMIEVLSLDKDLEPTLFEIFLEKTNRLQTNKTNGSLTKEEKKESQKEILTDAKTKFINVLTKDKWQIWQKHLKARRKKSSIINKTNLKS